MPTTEELEALEKKAAEAEQEARDAQRRAAASETLAVDARRQAEANNTQESQTNAAQATAMAARDKDAAVSAQQRANEARRAANQAAVAKLQTQRETPASALTISAINLGGMTFIAIGAMCLAMMCLICYRISPTIASISSSGIANLAWDQALIEIFKISAAPLLMLIAAVFSVLAGYGLLQTAGTAARQVIPPQDYPLLSQALLSGNRDALVGYIQLSSLTGFVGFFTKVGLTGLPLATIGLTLVFTFLAIICDGTTTVANGVNLRQGLLDLAKLTLGAFIGSYVTKGAPEAGSKVISDGGLKGTGSGGAK